MKSVVALLVVVPHCSVEEFQGTRVTLLPAL